VSQETFVEKVAHKLANLGLAGPVGLLLEAHKPLAFVSSQFLLVAQPTLNMFVSPTFTQGLVDTLADPTQMEQLISQLEQNAAPKRNPAQNKEAPP
jgi:hypothetical protein